MRDFKKKQVMSRDDAETMALTALRFLAEDPARLGGFLSLTGLGPDDLRSGAMSTAIQTAVLDHLLGDERMLLEFAAEAGIAPETVATAQHLLSGTTWGDEF